MLHRHLNHQRFTLAVIDDVIWRGGWGDWAELRRAVLANHTLLDKVERVCRAHASDPYAQRHHFWLHYAEAHRAVTCLGTRLVFRSTAPSHRAGCRAGRRY